MGLDLDKKIFSHNQWYAWFHETDKEVRKGLQPVSCSENQPYLRSMRYDWPVPTVVVINPAVFYRYARMTTKKGKPNKWLLCKKEKFKCKLCGETFPYSQLTLDHVVAQGVGGPDKDYNWTVMCQPCNNRKGDRMDVKDWQGRPVRPTFIPGWYIQIEDHEYRDEWETHLMGMNKI